MSQPVRSSFVRASDADRELVAGVLRENAQDGRLTLPEFEDRVARAYDATTLDDLHRLVDDLPVSLQGRLPVHTGSMPRGTRRDRRPPSPVAVMWAPWVGVSVLCLTIWLVASVASGGAIYFWPVWVFGPWGFVLLRRTLWYRRSTS